MGAKQNVGIKMCSICSTRETFINLCFAQTKLKQRNETKQARLSSLLLVSMEQHCLFPQVKRQSCLKTTLKSIRRISRAWSTRSAFQLAGTIGVVRIDI